MPLGAARITLLAFQPSVAAEAEVIRRKAGVRAINNAQIDTSTSQFGGASLQVDGLDDALETTFVKTFDGTGDFTIEMWAKGSGYGTRGKLFATYPHHSSLANSIFIDISGGTVIRCFINGADRAGGASWTNTAWNHIALQRTGELFEMFVNGTRVVNYSGGTPKDYSMDSSAGFHLGGTYSSAGVYNDEFNGHLDEVRVSEIARYTSGASITVPTAPFVNDSDTVLLLHMDGTDGSTLFEDDNGVRLPSRIEVGNDTQIDTSTSQFGGGSAIFDGTNDALRVYVDQNRVPTVGVNRYAGAFTLEFWFYMPNNPGATAVIPCANRLGGGFGVREFMFLVENLNIRIAYNAYNGSDPIQNLNMNGSGAFATSTWHHIAWAYDGVDEYSVWLNGTRFNNVTTTYSNHELGINAIQLGGYGSVTNPGNDFPGSIDEFRVSGVDRYGVTNSSITVPTAPFVNDDDTWFLLHMDGTDGSTDFQDDNGTGRARVGVKAVNDAQIETAQSKFGSSSLLLDGVNDYLECDVLLPETGDWTVEYWAYQKDFNTNDGHWGMTASSNQLVTSRTDKAIRMDIDPDILITSAGDVLSVNTWQHIAAVREGNVFSLYVDGSRVATQTQAGVSMPTTGAFRIGQQDAGTEINGNMDEWRISDTARYTGTSYSVPTEPFENDDNTLLLLHMDGTDGSTTFIDDNGAPGSYWSE